MTFLCYLEAVNLSHLYQDCNDLSTSRGGGLAVLSLGQDAAQWLNADGLHATVVSQGASQGLLRVEAADEERIRGLLRRCLRDDELLRYATVAIGTLPEEPGALPRQRAQLQAMARWQQMTSPAVVYPPLRGRSVCRTDGLRPAPEGEESPFTRLRRDHGRRKKHDLLREILGEEAGSFEVVQHIQELAAGGDRFGNLKEKIAVLHFDGNSFGSQSASRQTPEALSEFSEGVIRQQKAFFKDLVNSGGAEWWSNLEGVRKLRLEIVLFGGDEIAFLTPAWLGWSSLVHFYDYLKRHPPVRGAELTYSAGLVFCHQKAPIHPIKVLAHDLSDQAKARGQGKGNFVCYQSLESFDNVGQDLDEYLDRLYRFTGGTGVRLSAEQAALLEQHMPAWRGALSKRKLFRLARQAGWGESPEKITKESLAESADALDAASAQALDCLLSGLGAAAVLHLAELWDYAGGAR